MYNSEVAYQLILNLKQHAQNNSYNMQELFHLDKNREKNLFIQSKNISLNYSKNLINNHTIELFAQSLEACQIQQNINNMLKGECINIFEQRPALHIALRLEHELIPSWASGQVKKSLNQMEDFCASVHSKQNITDIIHIGIGGSDLGCKTIYTALSGIYPRKIRSHFVNNIDAMQLEEILSNLQAKNTLLIACSKTFTTLETCCNLEVCIKWLQQSIKNYSNHIVGISANLYIPSKYEIKNFFYFPEWVGGRFSVWGTVGLVVMLCYGAKVFKELLVGAANMDINFINNKLSNNMAQILAMLGIWYRNVFNISNYCIAAYAHNLSYFTAYLQQLDMESNGKSIGKDNKYLPYHTAPIIFGEVGTHCQHAYFQLLHQGTQWVPVDFISYLNPVHYNKKHHEILLRNCLAQAQALMLGRFDNNPQFMHIGNRPSNMLLLKNLNAFSIGSLLALYEHKIFTQGIFWHINSFDQWGVEFGKQLANHIEF